MEEPPAVGIHGVTGLEVDPQDQEMTWDTGIEGDDFRAMGQIETGIAFAVASSELEGLGVEDTQSLSLTLHKLSSRNPSRGSSRNPYHSHSQTEIGALALKSSHSLFADVVQQSHKAVVAVLLLQSSLVLFLVLLVSLVLGIVSSSSCSPIGSSSVQISLPLTVVTNW
ncbi:hypothetical protein PIB30_008096 [Stylosanthes scabra]|uniref:Uncharacterized protein n=1 Tax=Stylosanthes scabra TaxID=79078 RepID=A0ABU6X4U8_9FABA|nr:hypothetical protein [Stylosanthes scabra]